MSFQSKLFKYESKLNNLQKGGSDLTNAISENNLEEVRRLLTETPALINNDIVFFANSVEMLQLLIEFGCKIDIRDSSGDPLLIYLARRNRHELVLFLVNYGADISMVDNGYNNILDYYLFLSSTNNTYSYDDSPWGMANRVYDPTITTVYKLLLNKGGTFNRNSLIRFKPHSRSFVPPEYDINELNLIKKNNMVLPALVTHPEAFNINYVRFGRPTVKWYQYLKEAYNITEAEILAMATKMALERRMPAALSQRRYLKEESIRIADDAAAASAPPSPPSAPPNAGAGTGP